MRQSIELDDEARPPSRRLFWLGLAGIVVGFGLLAWAPAPVTAAWSLGGGALLVLGLDRVLRGKRK